MDPTVFFSVPTLSLFFFFFLFILSTRSNRNPSKKKPGHVGLKYYPLVGNLPQFVHNRHRLLDWITDLLASAPTNTFYIRRLGLQGVVTANPANVEHILKNNFENYPKGSRFISILEDFLGNGIFNSDGHQWKVQRKTASFEFNTRSLRNFVVDNVQKEIVTRLVPLLTKAASGDTVVDLQDVLERFAFDNVCKIAFDVDPACLAEDPEESSANKLASGFAQAFSDAANLSAGRFRYAVPKSWKVKKMLGIGSERRLAESVATVHDFATKIIRSRKKEKEAFPSTHTVHDDLLSRFMANGDSSEEYLRDIVISFILAGRDTTSSSLSWFFWVLSSRPQVVENILEELRSARAQNHALGEAFGFDELKEMPYLHAAISESLRLYPPVAANTTQCLSDDVLPDGTEVKEGWFASYNAYAMGRMESIWGEDCREYKPERWLDESGAFKPASPYNYPVFHAGPRTCLGKEMAYIQMKSIAACLMERFEIEVVEKEKQPEAMLSLTLRMKNGLPVMVKERCGSEVSIN